MKRKDLCEPFKSPVATNNGIKKSRKEIPWTIMRYSYKVTEPELEKLAEEIVHWASITEHTRATSLLADFQIYWGPFQKWMNMSEKLKEAYQLVKFILGERRERRALEGSYNAQMVMATMPTWDPELKAWKQEQAAAKERETSVAPVQLIMHSMPETDAVPYKKIIDSE